MKRAKSFKDNFIKNHPEHKERVEDYYQLMIDEIEEGESKKNEIDLFISSCNDLLDIEHE